MVHVTMESRFHRLFWLAFMPLTKTRVVKREYMKQTWGLCFHLVTRWAPANHCMVTGNLAYLHARLTDNHQGITRFCIELKPTELKLLIKNLNRYKYNRNYKSSMYNRNYRFFISFLTIFVSLPTLSFEVE